MSPTDLYKVKKIPISCAINPTEYFINQAKEIHGDLYDYSLVEYVNNETKVFITSKYRTFDQTPQGHLSGKGCKLVGREKSKKWITENPTGWSWDAWEKAGFISKKFVAFQCYIIKCWNDDRTEVFYKIGKTFVSIKERFRCNAVFPYNYEILMLTDNSARYISELENKLKKSLPFCPAISSRKMKMR